MGTKRNSSIPYIGVVTYPDTENSLDGPDVGLGTTRTVTVIPRIVAKAIINFEGNIKTSFVKIDWEKSIYVACNP